VRTQPILMVHGLGSSFEHGWREPGWVDLLSDSGRAVIPVDLLGHGNADKPHDPAAYEDLESCVRAVLPDEPVDAVGFSLGGQLLLRIAAADPARFGKLVVIGVGSNLFRDDAQYVAALADAFENGAGEDDVASQLFVRFAEGAGNDTKALAACLRRPWPRFTKEELAGVTAPVLVIMGDRDFAGPPDPLVDALPDARLVTLPGIDHFRSSSDFHSIDATLEFLEAV
jgi:pimeloyl-ACP methyl ester carboxylesterase